MSIYYKYHQCDGCGSHKPSHEFTKLKKSSQSKREIFCNLCKYNRLRILKNKPKEKPKSFIENIKKEVFDDDNIRDKQYIYKYGITEEEYDIIREIQDFCCKICKTSEKKLKKRLYVDHCHKTGVIRGLLCGHCNSGLGFFKDNTCFLSEAIVYLSERKED